MTDTADVVIVGGGIVGMATAVTLQERAPGTRIVVVEKEPEVARHQSGRNSGVIHAGVYYRPGSLKARFCREGAAATEAFCAEHGIRFDRCGKVIVATSPDEVPRMQALGARARANGIVIEDMDQAALREAEPNVTGVAALYSPRTGIVDYGQINRHLARLFTERGGTLRTGTRVTGGSERGADVVLTLSDGTLSCGHLVACAGLHADRLIRAFGQAAPFRIVPFRGEYFRIRNQPGDLVRHLIYPVPDPARPFLGVHLTRKLDGGFTVGPNAVLAMAREGYGRSLSLRDLADTLGFAGFWRMLAGNLRPALSELAASRLRRLYLSRVRRYCPRVALRDLAPYRPGIRAQAIGHDGRIVDDFLFVKTERCLHVGNAPSPAATSAFPIADHILAETGLA